MTINLLPDETAEGDALSNRKEGNHMGFGIIDGHFHIGAEAARWVDDVTWQSALALMDRLDIERAISANLLIFPYNGCRMEEGLAIDADIYEKSGRAFRCWKNVLTTSCEKCTCDETCSCRA